MDFLKTGEEESSWMLGEEAADGCGPCWSEHTIMKENVDGLLSRKVSYTFEGISKVTPCPLVCLHCQPVSRSGNEIMETPDLVPGSALVRLASRQTFSKLELEAAK